MKRFITALVLLASISGVCILNGTVLNPEQARNAQVAEASDSKIISTKIENTPRSTTLEDSLTDILSAYSDLTIGITVVNIDNDYIYNAGYSDTAFKAASTTKVLTATYLMHQIEVGELSLQTSIGGATAETHLQRMLQNSDNTSWATLINYLGDDDIESYAHEIGMTSYAAGDYNTITTSDFAVLLTKLQKSQLISAAHRDVIYGYMQNTNNETLIPAALSTATVYHKWGMLWGNLHDVAIIEQEGHTYAVVIYTNYEGDTADMNAAQTTAIHEIIETFQNEIDTN